MKKSEKIAIGNRIKEYRIKANLKQGNLAELAGIDTNNLSRIERGQAVPKLETILNISSALHITPNDLLLESYDAPLPLIDAEISNLLRDMNANDRKKVMEYIRFIRG